MNFLRQGPWGNDVIGVDIGTHTIKVMQMERQRDGWAPKRAGMTPTPGSALKGGIIDDPLPIAQALNELLRALDLHAGHAVCGVAGLSVVARTLQLPAMPEPQLRKTIRWEIRNYISFPVEDAVTEFSVMNPGEAGGQAEVMVVACPRDIVNHRMLVLDHCGLEPIAVEIDPFAALRALADLHGYHNGNGHGERPLLAFVGIGASWTDITILRGNEFILTRSLPLAGNHLTEAIASTLSVDDQAAQQLKESGLQVVRSEEQRSLLSPDAQQASRAIEPFLEELARELRRSLAYYDFQQPTTETPEEAPTAGRIILYGGTARLPGLAAYFEHALNLPTETAQLFAVPAGTQPDSEEAAYFASHGPTWATVTGLALREYLANGNGKRRKGAH